MGSKPRKRMVIEEVESDEEPIKETTKGKQSCLILYSPTVLFVFLSAQFRKVSDFV